MARTHILIFLTYSITNGVDMSFEYLYNTDISLGTMSTRLCGNHTITCICCSILYTRAHAGRHIVVINRLSVNTILDSVRVAPMN